jgi:transcription termination factor NusB
MRKDYVPQPVPEWADLFAEKKRDVDLQKAQRDHFFRLVQTTAFENERLRAIIENVLQSVTCSKLCECHLKIIKQTHSAFAGISENVNQDSE